MIKRVKVRSEDALKDPNYRFPGNYGVEKYLELFSGKNKPLPKPLLLPRLFESSTAPRYRMN